MKVLFVYPRFARHAEANPELLDFVPMNEYLGSPSLGIACMAALTPCEKEYRDDRLEPADRPTDADVVALSFFTPAAKRGMELADYFRAQGKTVIAGGIFPTMMPDTVQPHVDAVVVGEGELVWPKILADIAAGTLKPRYEERGVDLEQVPVPDLSLYFGSETDTFKPDDYPLQITRGCSLSCKACVLPTSMTRKQRGFSVEHILAQLDQISAEGRQGCLTEDTSWFPSGIGRKRLMELIEAIIESGRPAPISYVGISLPMILITPERLFRRARTAGIDMFYLVMGFDPVSNGAFTGKDPRALQRAKDAIAKAYDVGIEPYTSFLLGGDQDDEGTVDRMLEWAEATKMGKAEFAIATPYPGTPEWHKLVSQDRILTKDWSKYNDANVVFKPKNMTPDQLHEGYLRLWREFYATRMHLADLPVGERTIQF